MPETDPFLSVALTVDVDPDANRPVPGRPDAVSAGADGRVNLRACRRGLEALVSLAEDLDIPCAFFWEARSLRVLSRTGGRLLDRILDNPAFEHGCHGLRHEDFSGRRTGVPIDEERTLDILREATHIVESETGRQPAGFRAPYCRLTPEAIQALARLGYVYDATLMRDACDAHGLLPYALPGADGRVQELPLPRGRGRRGRPITGYLWQLFEGRRRPEDHVEFAAAVADRCAGGLFQLALHPWHLVVNERGEPLPTRPGLLAAEGLRAVLTGVLSLEAVRLVAPARYLAQAARGAEE